MSLALVRLIQGFIKFRDTIGPVLYFANISVRLNMAKDYIYITNVRLQRSVCVSRCTNYSPRKIARARRLDCRLADVRRVGEELLGRAFPRCHDSGRIR